MHILSRDSIPKAILEREDVHLNFFNTENLGMRELNDDLAWANIDREVLPQIEPGVNVKCAMQLYPLGAAHPGMQEFVFDLDPA